jgi:hypothetical protein
VSQVKKIMIKYYMLAFQFSQRKLIDVAAQPTYSVFTLINSDEHVYLHAISLSSLNYDNLI